MNEAALPAHIRARGTVRARFSKEGGRSHLARHFEEGGLRLRCPRAAGACEGVLINTAGGMAGGDSATYEFEIAAGADVTLTTQSAEKIYRADSGPSTVHVTLTLEAGASAEWLPQETILFDRSRLARRLDVAMADGASLTLLETLVFGRLAMDEAVRAGDLHDSWRIRRAGKLVMADELRLDGDMSALLDRPALGKGARACATFVHVSPDAEGRLDSVRAALSNVGVECAASAFNGMIVARFLSPAPEKLRAALVGFLQAFRGKSAPRVWQ